MTTSDAGIKFIIKQEGCVLHTYYDAVNVPTIGVGNTSHALPWRNITQEEADNYLREDLKWCEKVVNSYANKYGGWTQNEFDALVSYVFNVGQMDGLTASGTRTREEIAEDWLKHNKAKGKVLEVLTVRRKKELELFLRKETDMKESEIVICGHGSGTPSLKNMYTYLQDRYNQKANNGVRKGLVAVVRFRKFDDAGRKRFHDYYKSILGRNKYSQNLRIYVYHPYKDGKYYSDCSSSGIYTIKEEGYTVPNYNTEAMYKNAIRKDEDRYFDLVDVKIVNGHVMNPEVLKVGDALLFAGNDPKREKQIGHVEYVYELPNPTYDLGWHLDNVGWWYADTPTTYFKNCWQKINHHWYYFKESGYIATEWRKIDEKWYYFEPSGDLMGALYHESDARDGSLEIWYVD